MNKTNQLITSGIIFLLWFSLAFACNNGSSQSRSSRQKSPAPVSRRVPSNTATSGGEDSDDEDGDETATTQSTRQNTDDERTSVTTQMGIGATYGARNPYACAITNQPTNERAAAENFRCSVEGIYAGKLHLVDNVIVSEMESPRQYERYKDMEAWGIDVSQNVTPIDGNYDEYVCDEVSDYMQNRGKNCMRFAYSNAKGICYKKSDGEWKCIMQDTISSGNTVKDQAPPR